MTKKGVNVKAEKLRESQAVGFEMLIKSGF